MAANISITAAIQYPTLLLVEIFIGVLAPEIGHASTVFRGANYIAYFERTVVYNVTLLHSVAVLSACLADTYTVTVSFRHRQIQIDQSDGDKCGFRIFQVRQFPGRRLAWRQDFGARGSFGAKTTHSEEYCTMISAVYNTIIIVLKSRLQWRYNICGFARCVTLSAEIMLAAARVCTWRYF